MAYFSREDIRILRVLREPAGGIAAGELRLFPLPAQFGGQRLHELPRYALPAQNPQSTTLGSGATVTVSGAYARNTGSVTIITSSQAAPWTILDCQGGVYSGTGNGVAQAVPTGPITICWGHLYGYSTPNPNPEMHALGLNETATFNGDFIREKGTVSVQVTPDSAPWSFVDGDGIEHSGTGNASIIDIPTGDIEMSWGTIPGQIPPYPNPVIQTLFNGDNVMFDGAYTAPHEWTGFNQQPQDGRAYAGSTCALSVSLGWEDPYLAFTWWHKSGNAPAQVGTNTAQLDLDPVSPDDTGQYWCNVSYNGSTYSSNTATLSVADHLTIDRQPQGGLQHAGGTYTFDVGITGGFAPFTYSWKHDGVEVGTNPTLTLNNLGIANVGTYTVEVSDSYVDVVQSEPASLSINEGLPVGSAATGGIVVLAVALLALRRIRNRSCN